ncbi:unnamed protein product [Pleuronectes platessa]|uniref:Uncharacterized protein n=1 Tax=Pleuronectes platessa TaxID=8262 RepID=A0A9N7TMC0_PLEPL|nr:unnamed protein product [Pleuronectes platessa]
MAGLSEPSRAGAGSKLEEGKSSMLPDLLKEPSRSAIRNHAALGAGGFGGREGSLSSDWTPRRVTFHPASCHERRRLLLYEFWVTLPRRQAMPKYSRLQCDRSGEGLLIGEDVSVIKASPVSC